MFKIKQAIFSFSSAILYYNAFNLANSFSASDSSSVFLSAVLTTILIGRSGSLFCECVIKRNFPGNRIL